MAFLHGRNTFVYLNQFNLSTYFNQSQRTTTIETADTTTYLQDNKSYIAGLADGTFSLQGLFDGAAAAVDETLTNIIQAATNPVVTIVHARTLAVSAPTDSGEGVFTSYGVSSPVGDVVSCSAEFQGSGGVRSGRLIGYGQSVSATGNGTSVDGGAATTNGGFATLHLPVNTRNGAITFTVEHSTDNTTFTSLGAFSATVASTPTYAMKTFTGTINRYVRLAYTVAGATGAATPIVSICRF
jgi:hypothetical protein